MRGRLRVWHRRGLFSPSWLSGLPGWLSRIVALPSAAWLFYWALQKGSEASLSVFLMLAIGCLLALWFLWWAPRDAKAREDLQELALRGSVAKPVGLLTLDDLMQNQRQHGSGPAFMPRRIRRFEDPDSSGSLAVEVIPSLLPEEGRQSRRVAIVAAPGMGKTRLIHHLIHQLPPETMVFAPSRGLQGRSDAELRHSTRYLRKKECVLVLDDLNFYIRRTDVAVLEHVIDKRASRCAVVATCTPGAVPQVQSERDPALSRFFSGLHRFELLRMTDEQMHLLASDPTAPATQRPPSDYAGNPGLLLLDSQRLREEWQTLSNQEMAVAQAINGLFLAGISPIKVEQVSALARVGFGSDLARPLVDEALKRLRSWSLIQEEDTVIPDESLFREVFADDEIHRRMDEGLEEVLSELGDPVSLFQLGDTYHSKGDMEGTIRLMRMVSDLAGAAATADNQIIATAALFNLGVVLEGHGGSPGDIEAVYREAAEAGCESGTPAGLLHKAKALYNLGIALSQWGRSPADVEAAYREAAEVGRESGIPDGLLQTAKALVNLGIALKGWERSPADVEAAYREAAEVGRESGISDGLAETAKALFNLGFALMQWERFPGDIEAVYREAVEAGRESGTPHGLLHTTKALVNLGIALKVWERSPEDIETVWRRAAQTGRESGTPECLVETAKALLNLGVIMDDSGRPSQDIEAAYRASVEAGQESGTPEGRQVAARALTYLRNSLEDERE